MHAFARREQLLQDRVSGREQHRPRGRFDVAQLDRRQFADERSWRDGILGVRIARQTSRGFGKGLNRWGVQPRA